MIVKVILTTMLIVIVIQEFIKTNLEEKDSKSLEVR